VDTQSPDARQARHGDEHFAIGLARAFGGALIFSLPMLMTMEMWQLGFYIDPLRLALLLLIFFPLLVILSHRFGFEETVRWLDDALDACVAYAVGFITAGLVLLLFAVLLFGMPLAEIINKISVQAVPASIGAVLARSQFGRNKPQQQGKEQPSGYSSELVLMVIGALFLSFNMAPTEEMVLISYQITRWHAIALALVSIIIMHAFVYAVEFKGQVAIPPNMPLWSVFLRFTIVGYAIALLISLYILWTFNQIEDMSTERVMMAVIVLSFPAAIGAAAARLIL
jgi:putative integral membrane protein (TIGR02587 family)